MLRSKDATVLAHQYTSFLRLITLLQISRLIGKDQASLIIKDVSNEFLAKRIEVIQDDIVGQLFDKPRKADSE